MDSVASLQFEVPICYKGCSDSLTDKLINSSVDGDRLPEGSWTGRQKIDIIPLVINGE